jgi:hypothetical protein
VGHVHGSTFVPNVDDPHTVLRELIPNRLNVTTLETE